MNLNMKAWIHEFEYIHMNILPLWSRSRFPLPYCINKSAWLVLQVWPRLSWRFPLRHSLLGSCARCRKSSCSWKTIALKSVMKFWVEWKSSSTRRGKWALPIEWWNIEIKNSSKHGRISWLRQCPVRCLIPSRLLWPSWVSLPLSRSGMNWMLVWH